MAGFIKGLKTLFGDVEMAPYTSVDHETYEERVYPAKKWVCTCVNSIDRESSVSSMFRLLFNYISGKNKPNIRIDMTSPVTTYVEPGASATCESKFTMAFFIPEEHQENPPEPVETSIFIENRYEMTVLTRIFGGFSSEATVIKEAKELAEILQAAGEEGVNYDQYYIVGYDPPYKLFNRRNEIWFVKSSSRSREEEASETAVKKSDDAAVDQLAE